MKDYISNIKSYQRDKSTVAAHVWKPGNTIEEGKLLKLIQNLSE